MKQRFRTVIWSFVKRALGRDDRRISGNSGSPADQSRINSITGRPRGWLSTRTSNASSKDSEMLHLNVMKRRVSFTVPLVAIPEKLHSELEVEVRTQVKFFVGGDESVNGEANIPLLY